MALIRFAASNGVCCDVPCGVVASLVDNVNIKQLKGTLLLDQKDKYGLDTQVRISKKGSEVTYLPTMELRRLTNTQQILTGSITRDGVQKIDIDLTSNIVTADPVNIKGNNSAVVQYVMVD